MLKVIVKAINVVTAGYVVYTILSVVYEMGKEARDKENNEK